MKKSFLFLSIFCFFLLQSSDFFATSSPELFSDDVMVEHFDDLSAGNEDPLDKLVEIGKRADVLPEKPEFPPPTKMQIILAKIGMPFLNLYFFTSDKVRYAAAWFAKKLQAIRYGAICNYFRTSPETLAA